MTLEEAILQLIELGEKDPLEIARKLEHRHGLAWITIQLAERREEILSEMARRTLGTRRRHSTLPSVVTPHGRTRKKGDVMLSSIFIPGTGWKALGECTKKDLAQREQFYLSAAGVMVRWATWCSECIVAMDEQGVETLGKIAQLPQLPIDDPYQLEGVT